jgi:hypothetical protein
MDTAEKCQKELESCIGSINSAGLDKLDPQNIEKLEKISAAATSCGMNQGKKLVDNLVTVLKSFKEGKAAPDSVSVRLTALEFYLNNTTGAATEEL